MEIGKLFSNDDNEVHRVSEATVITPFYIKWSMLKGSEICTGDLETGSVNLKGLEAAPKTPAMNCVISDMLAIEDRFVSFNSFVRLTSRLLRFRNHKNNDT